MDNLTLEKLYCDVSIDTLVNFKPTQFPDVSLLKRQVIRKISNHIYRKRQTSNLNLKCSKKRADKIQRYYDSPSAFDGTEFW